MWIALEKGIWSEEWEKCREKKETCQEKQEKKTSALWTVKETESKRIKAMERLIMLRIENYKIRIKLPFMEFSGSVRDSLPKPLLSLQQANACKTKITRNIYKIQSFMSSSAAA